MAVPKRRKSASRTRMQRAENMKLHEKNFTSCSNCNEEKHPHHVCPSCGMYNGRQILSAPENQ